MTDFELITQPRKKLVIKLELINAPRNDFSFLKKYVQWNYYNNNTWASIQQNSMTWGAMALRNHQGQDMPSVEREMQGDAVDMKLTIDSESDIRKVLSLTLHMKDGDYAESHFHSMWMNRLIRVSVGIYDWDNGAYRYFVIGMFLVTEADYTYDATTQNLELSLADLMATLTESRGNMIGAEVEIDNNDTPGSLKNALEAFIAQFFPYTFSDICAEFGQLDIPYDLEFERGIYPYEVVKKMIDLYPTYEHYYNYVETPAVPQNIFKEVYTVRKVPSRIDELPVMSAEQTRALVISETGKATPGKIKNVTQVIGKEIEDDYADYSATSCVTQVGTTTNNYLITLDAEFERYEHGMIIGFTADADCKINQTISMRPEGGQALNNISIMTMNGLGVLTPVTAGQIMGGIHYVGKYSNGVFILEGPSIITAMAVLYNKQPTDAELAGIKSQYNCNDIRVMLDPDNPFSVEAIGQNVQVFVGGDFENIYTTDLAKERAYYENWRSARLTDTLSVKMLYVPWLTVNQKIRYTSIATGETKDYIITSISVNLAEFTMDVTMCKFFPYYPEGRAGHSWGSYSEVTWSSVSNMTWDRMGFDPE